jgi:hypothetical protein
MRRVRMAIKWICRRNFERLGEYLANPGTEIHFDSAGFATSYKPDGTCLLPSEVITEEGLMKLMHNTPAWDLIDPDDMMDEGL